MKKYIGTKLIEAVPAIRKGGEVYEKTQPIPRSMDPEEDGYKVRYPDGYESFSPKQVFEEAYRPTDGLSFGLAIEAAKKGMKIARRGWNGKNQYVELAERISYENAAHEVINAKHEAIGNKALAFVGTSGVQLGWLASQADMLADDWMIGEAAAENHCCDEDCERSRCDKETAADGPAAPKLPTVRLFISQPMRGKSDEEIESEREDLIVIAKAVYAGRGEVEVIDSFFKGGLDVPAGAKAPLYYLSKSLELLATADVAIFAKDWREARGCRIEHECADGYGVTRIELPEEG